MRHFKDVGIGANIVAMLQYPKIVLYFFRSFLKGGDVIDSSGDDDVDYLMHGIPLN